VATSVQVVVQVPVEADGGLPLEALEGGLRNKEKLSGLKFH